MSTSRSIFSKPLPSFINVFAICLLAFKIGLRYLEIERALEAAQEEEKQIRASQIEDLKSSWKESSMQRTMQRTIQKNLPDYEPTKLSVSSAQLLDGEDRSRANRNRQQKEQMKRWIQEQISEKAYARDLEREEERRYADSLRIIGEMRDEADREEAEMRKTMLNSALNENEAVSLCVFDFNAERERKKKREGKKIIIPLALPPPPFLFCVKHR